MRPSQQTIPPLEELVTRLHESHEVSVYEAIERLVQAGAAVGLDEHALLRKLDHGMTFEALMAEIESRMESARRVA